MKKIYSILIIAILATVVFASGCTDSSANSTNGISLDKTFSKSGITFNYPSSWENVQSSDVVTGGDQVIKLGNLGDDSGQVFVQKVDLTKYPSTTIEQLRDLTKQSFKSSSDAQVVSDTRSTVNGVTMYELIFANTDPVNNDEYKHYYVVTGKSGKAGYYLDFYSLSSDFDQQLLLFKDIEQTIKIS